MRHPSDTRERSELARTTQAEFLGAPTPQAQTQLEDVWHDFVFGEVLSQPALPRRVRYLCALASLVLTGATEAMVDRFVRGALQSGDLSLSELREAALHLCPYAGWVSSARLDEAITRVLGKQGLAEPPTEAIRGSNLEMVERSRSGAQVFQKVVQFPCPPPTTPFALATRDFVFGELWTRKGLDQRARRWLALVGTCASLAEIGFRSHIHAALASGDCTPEEMQAFVLQYAVFHGWHRATIIQATVNEMIGKVEAGRPRGS